jgi:hypothetical protein
VQREVHKDAVKKKEERRTRSQLAMTRPKIITDKKLAFSPWQRDIGESRSRRVLLMRRWLKIAEATNQPHWSPLANSREQGQDQDHF